MVHKGITEPVAETVRQAIEAAGLSKRQVAIRSGLAPTTLDRKLSGRTDFTLTELHALSVALDVEIYSLIPSGLDAVA
jgi:transcriptional regulator with XRE-family HTH domain